MKETLLPRKKHPILFVALLSFAIPAVSLVSGQTLQTSCTVGTPLANNAIVRVQPGEAERSLTFLFPGRQYPVTGHIVESDSSEWWSLDRAEFASRSLESDPWVSAAEVSPSGDCDAFAASATSTSGETSGTGTATPSAGRSIISVRATLRAALGTGSSSFIREGLWELTLTNVAVNCGGESLNLGPQEADDLIPIDPSDAPDSLLFAGSVLQSDATGMYHGQFDLPLVGRMFDADITLTIVSDTYVTGTLIAHLGDCNYESEVELNHEMDLDD